ncbi:MAG: hypothetical protein WAK94_03255 [Steroidobacteraceae bacterium]
MKRVALVLCLIGMVISIRFLALLPDRLDPQGDSNGICTVSPVPPVASSNGMEVTAHLTVCSGGFVHDSATYVYLHKVDEKESPRSLVFRFSNDPYAAPPVIRWIDPSHLAISVDTVELVTKILPSFEGVAIAYSVGHEKGERGQWQQQVLAIKRAAVATAVLTLVLLLLSVWLWFSIRNDKRARTGHAVCW